MDVKVGGSLARANQDDLDKLLNIGEELDIPVRVDTYMMPATRERDLPYNMQSRLNPEEAARARIHALKREMGPELFPQYVRQSVERADHPEPAEVKNRDICPVWQDSVLLPSTGRARCVPA